MVAEETKRQVLKYDLNVELITAKTPLKERLVILDKHEKGEIESLISVGVLSEGWDNPNCNIIVHLRPTLSKVFGVNQLVGVLDLQKIKKNALLLMLVQTLPLLGQLKN